MNLLPAKKAPYRAACLFNLALFTVGAKAANTINVAVQLKDVRNKAIGQPGVCDVYLSDNADGSTLTATGTTSAIAVHTSGVIMGAITANKAVEMISTAAGLFDLDIIQTASPLTYYLVVVMPDGSLAVSPAVTF